MMKYYKLTKKEEVLSIIIKWFEDQFKEAPVENNVNTMVKMLTLAYLYEETGNPAYLPYLETWGEGCIMICQEPEMAESSMLCSALKISSSYGMTL
jgi:rhamnogalacturonyl hydrolase YesR